MAACRGYVFVGVIIIILLLANLSLVPFGDAAALSFDYDFSVHGDLERANLLYLNDSFADGDRISLTKMTNGSAGRVAYAQPVPLWNCRTGSVANFSTSFSFAIGGNHNITRGDGMAFFVGPFPPIVPSDSLAGFLGLYNDPAHSGSPPTVAVEFDTFWNEGLDPPLPLGVNDHVGIDINSIHSTGYTTDLQNLSLYGTMSANITYDAGSKKMEVRLRLADGSTHSVETPVDFRGAGLPQDVAIGFSAATGTFWESRQVLSWSFNSTDVADAAMPTDPSCKKNKQRWVIAVAAIIAQGACLVAVVLHVIVRECLRLARRRLLQIALPELPGATNDTMGIQEGLSYQQLLEAMASNPSDDTLGTGISLPVPRQFTYEQLSAATNNLSRSRKLGEGAFGEVYGGALPGQHAPLPVAVKRLTLQTERARRDYIIEIMTLGQLYHRNLVKLVGWCNDGGGGAEHLLLVYELMTKRSVDRYLHGPERLLTWPERYKVVLGVGYAIEYLHTGCPSPILHRDIKPSNVLLNDDFVAKLGDFGLVRQVPRHGYLRGTAMMGSTDYIDPVCISNSTATTASDMYSFGVLLLEIATGKDPAVEQQSAGRPCALVEAVRESYASDTLLQMADPRLNANFDQWQMERVLVVGLLCVQPDRHDRPSIRDAVHLLSNLALQLPDVRL